LDQGEILQHVDIPDLIAYTNFNPSGLKSKELLSFIDVLPKGADPDLLISLVGNLKAAQPECALGIIGELIEDFLAPEQYRVLEEVDGGGLDPQNLDLDIEKEGGKGVSLEAVPASSVHHRLESKVTSPSS
jgi:hypothetical protein